MSDPDSIIVPKALGEAVVRFTRAREVAETARELRLAFRDCWSMWFKWFRRREFERRKQRLKAACQRMSALITSAYIDSDPEVDAALRDDLTRILQDVEAEFFHGK
jgi:hypothetical protein